VIAVGIASVVPVSTSAVDLVCNTSSPAGEVCVAHWGATEQGLFTEEEYYCEITGCVDGGTTVTCTADCYLDEGRTQYWDEITATPPWP
jgi:hypothetical protein